MPDQYTVAIKETAGGAMQNLVVDREEDRKGRHQYLKRRTGGRATILPPQPIRPGRTAGGGVPPAEPGFGGWETSWSPLIPGTGLCFPICWGRVAVMEDLDAAIAAARRYGYRFRIVTLDGQVLNPEVP